MLLAPVASPSVLAQRPQAGGIQQPTLPALEAATQVATPAGDLARRYGRDLLAIAGAHTLVVSSRTPDTLRVEFVDEAKARLAAGLLKAEIDGVKLELAARGSELPVELPEHEAAGTASDRVRAVAALTGVWAYTYRRTGANQHGSVQFSTINEGVVERLKPILRHRISFGWMPETGEPRYLYFSWYPRIPKGS